MANINPIQVQQITEETGNFLGPNIAPAGIAGTFTESPVKTVVVQVLQKPVMNWEYAISGTMNQDGFGQPYNENKFYCTDFKGNEATFKQIIPT